MSETEKTKKPAEKKTASKKETTAAGAKVKVSASPASKKAASGAKKVVVEAQAPEKTLKPSATRVVKKEDLEKKPVAARQANPVDNSAQAIASDITLSDLKAALKVKDKEVEAVKQQAVATREKKVDSLGRSYATGKRKDAVARVWIKPGRGRVVVNGREEDVYFKRAVLRMMIHQPFKIVERIGQYDVQCTLAGGGLSGQAGALRHGISKALVAYEPDLRTPLKAAGFLTRDSRTVERKKYGQPKARRRFQFSKR